MAAVRTAEELAYGGLASWQATRLRSFVEDRLASTLRVSDLAGVVGLSMSHFFRTFRRVVGTNPTAWRREFALGPGPAGMPTLVGGAQRRDSARINGIGVVAPAASDEADHIGGVLVA
jgi:hypothetical protein